MDLKSPGCICSLKDSIIQDLPSTFTARDTFDFIKKNVKALSTSNAKCMEHLISMLTREYIPGQNGVGIYFTNACKLDHHRARTIRVAEVPDTQIMVAAQIAFCHEVDNNQIQEIDDKWEHAHTKTALYISLVTKYTWFKEH